MIIKNYYVINQHMMYMFGLLDRNAKVCTLVRDFYGVFIVDRSPLEILDDSLRSIGFNLKGAMESAKIIIENKMMCPVMLNHIHNICVFPDKSHKHEDTIWFNPCQILRTHSIKRKTQIEFRNRLSLKIDSKLFSFNNKLKSAEQLSRITIENANNPQSYFIEPPKKNRKRKFKKAKK
ncbi:competence protein ComK [Neobacillus sp. DY30]|uniref:competence protein ComK n=1 Tax=Neobacillus sp. DY30 TaxID=3047871 RepID=UPI0024C0C6EC|nr:competence protein ComK [Neobacillus sp. DY30]WHY00372.1 competence protein ComK [Neobacillus sp. DY30]